MKNFIDGLKETLLNDQSLTSEQKKAIEDFIKADETKNKALKDLFNILNRS